MTPIGFHITSLSLTGPGVPKAEAIFYKGLNVIAGPSDTGKTFMVQCIDFAMGAGTAPKDIPESAGYDLVALGLQGADGKSYLLERALRGGALRLLQNGTQTQLSEKHDPDGDDNISQFFLGLCGLAHKRVQFNQRGVTHSLSFRNVAPLALIDEESIIAERSPILSGQFTQGTLEAAVFRVLLSGVDDSALIAVDKPKVAKEKREARVELLDELLERARAQLRELSIQDSRDQVADALAKLEAAFEQESHDLQTEQQSLGQLDRQRRTLWEAVRHADSRLDVLRQLRKRFELLGQQYASDLRRLDAIAEAGSRLAQLTEERCPVCGAAAEHHSATHRSQQASPQDVAAACEAEMRRIGALLTDLEKALLENFEEHHALAERRAAQQGQLDAASTELRSRLEPRVQAILGRLRESQAQRDKYRTAMQVFDRIAELEQLRGAAEKSAKRTKQPKAAVHDVGARDVEDFSQEVEKILRAWSFPELGRVTYSEDDDDIVISGQRRKSHGKGVRALTHAAFTLGLLQYCATKKLPHPCLAVLDSPLVVYREPDPNELGFAPQVKAAFYRSIAESFKDEQVIVFENDEPPADLDDIHIIKFSGTTVGRQGFIPARSSER